MPKSDQKHVILVVNDDLAQWALGCYGNREIHTPNLDYLATTGVQMDKRLHADAGLFAGARLSAYWQAGITARHSRLLIVDDSGNPPAALAER